MRPGAAAAAAGSVAMSVWRDGVDASGLRAILGHRGSVCLQGACVGLCTCPRIDGSQDFCDFEGGVRENEFGNCQTSIYVVDPKQICRSSSYWFYFVHSKSVQYGTINIIGVGRSLALNSDCREWVTETGIINSLIVPNEWYGLLYDSHA